MIAPGDLQEIIERALAAALRELKHLAPPDPQICLHEAAHVVVSWVVSDTPLLGVGVRDDGSGFTLRADVDADVGDDAALLRQRVERRIVGVLAAAFVDPQYERNLLGKRRGFSDLRAVDFLAGLVVAREARSAFLAPLREIAREAVHDNRFLIEVVAGMLRCERVLIGSDVERALAARGFRCDYGLQPLLSRVTPG